MKNKTAKSIVQKQLLNIYQHFTKISIIQEVDYPTIIEKNNQIIIGNLSERISHNNYSESTRKMIENVEYTILLTDLSIISIYYVFDKISENIIYGNLSFIPFKDSNEDLMSESKYIRIDYDNCGRKEYVHTLVHMHFSTYKNNVRIPLDHVVTPVEFVYIILKYFYEIDDPLLEKQDYSEKINAVVLSKNESKKLKISFGEW